MPFKGVFSGPNMSVLVEVEKLVIVVVLLFGLLAFDDILELGLNSTALVLSAVEPRGVGC